MSLLISILGAIFAFFIVVVVHEYGHFIVARAFGVKVHRFAIGFGKAIFKHRAKSGVEYVIGILPLGGYVKMQDAFSEAEEAGSVGNAFESKSLFARMCVVLAGPMMNLLLAIFLFAIVFTMGVIEIKPVISKVEAHSIASNAHFKSGDEIIQMGNTRVHNWQHVIMFLIAHIGDDRNLPIIVLPKQSKIPVTHDINLQHWQFNPIKPDLLASLGFTPHFPKTPPMKIRYSWYHAFTPAMHETARWVVFNVVAMKQMLLGRISPKAMGGPISIFQTAGAASLMGLTTYLQFIALISVVLGVLNLMPIPALDGGHFLFFVVEAVIRRPIPVRVQVLLINIGIIFLLSLMLYATFNDITRLIQ